MRDLRRLAGTAPSPGWKGTRGIGTLSLHPSTREMQRKGPQAATQSSRHLTLNPALATLTLMTQQKHSSGLTLEEIDDLRQRATAAAEHSYSPYSHFRVGAAVLLDAPDHGESVIVTGCNVENASFRLTTCAEQSAIVTAVGLYGPSLRIRAVAVANRNGAASMPCGACRQTILEFSTPETWIFYPAEQGVFAAASLADLLPAAFRLEPV